MPSAQPVTRQRLSLVVATLLLIAIAMLVWWQRSEQSPAIATLNTMAMANERAEQSATEQLPERERALAPAAQRVPSEPAVRAGQFPFRWSFVRHGAPEWPNISYVVPFGVDPGGALHYSLQSGLALELSARSPILTLLVDSGHLRRMQLRSGERTRIDMGEFLGTPSLGAGDASPPPPPFSATQPFVQSSRR